MEMCELLSSSFTLIPPMEQEYKALVQKERANLVAAEAQIPLAHCTVYLATAPKSNRAYAALHAAQADVKGGVTLAVPRHLRSTGSSRAKKALGHTGYQYSHDGEGAAGLSPRRPPLLRARRPGRGEAHQGAAGLLARTF